MIQLGPALGWGTLATGMLTLVLAASQGLGWTRISLPYVLGTMFVVDRSRAIVLGSALHWFIGMFFALVYAAIFDQLGHSGIPLGAALGALHGAFALIVGMEFVAAIHPRMASRHHGPTPGRRLEPPGFLALHYGRSTPLITLLAHVCYGAFLGFFYRPGP